MKLLLGGVEELQCSELDPQTGRTNSGASPRPCVGGHKKEPSGLVPAFTSWAESVVGGRSEAAPDRRSPKRREPHGCPPIAKRRVGQSAGGQPRDQVMHRRSKRVGDAGTAGLSPRPREPCTCSPVQSTPNATVLPQGVAKHRGGLCRCLESRHSLGRRTVRGATWGCHLARDSTPWRVVQVVDFLGLGRRAEGFGVASLKRYLGCSASARGTSTPACCHRRRASAAFNEST